MLFERGSGAVTIGERGGRGLGEGTWVWRGGGSGPRADDLPSSLVPAFLHVYVGL